MRYLHPVGPHETFVASGVYALLRGDQPTGQTLTWSIHEQPDGAHFIRIDRFPNPVDDWSVILEVWRSPPGDGGRIERLDLKALAPRRAIKQVRATYTLLDDHIEVGRTLNNGERLQESLALDGTAYLIPLPELLPGHVVTSAAEQDGQPVILAAPGIDFDDEQSAFTLRVSPAGFRCVDEGAYVVAGRSYPARRYVWISPAGATDPERELWVDEHGVLLADEADDGSRQLLLTQYVRRPEPKARS
jgi:hypothetical protein